MAIEVEENVPEDKVEFIISLFRDNGAINVESKQQEGTSLYTVIAIIDSDGVNVNSLIDEFMDDDS